MQISFRNLYEVEFKFEKKKERLLAVTKLEIL